MTEPIGAASGDGRLDEPGLTERPAHAESSNAVDDDAFAASRAHGALDAVDAPEAKPAVAAEQSLLNAFGGRKGILDSGLPLVIFVVTYLLSGHDMRLSVIVALTAGVILAVIQLVLRRPVQFAIAGLVSVGIAAYIASKTGEARNIFLPTILWNVGYAVLYAISALVRWPLIGVVVGAAQQNMKWREDPVLLRAYSRATWVWVGTFLLRLAVYLPLYFANALGAMAVARVALGVPVFALAVWLSFLIVRAATRTTHGAPPVTA